MHDQKKDKSKDYLLGLHWAATTGNVGLVKFALDHGAPIDSVVNGFMPLQLACISDNNIAVVQYLIDRGAEVNAQRWSKNHSVDKSQAVAGAIGSTALHVACANGCVKIVDLLLRNGAMVNVKDKYGTSPLDIAAAKHHVEIVRLLEFFGALQQQKQNNNRRKCRQEEEADIVPSRKSMDVSSMSPSEKAERFRRPSLPSVFEGKSQVPPLQVPPLSTLPSSSDPRAPRRSLNIPRPTQDELSSNDVRRGQRRPSRNNKTPELVASKSSDDSVSVETVTVGTPPTSSTTRTVDNPWQAAEAKSSSASVGPSTSKQPDWYGYGVVNKYDDENYLLSLERRAFEASDDIVGRRSMDRSGTSGGMRRSQSLKRCSSDGGHLRTTALMNAMAAKDAHQHTDGQDTEPTPRPSLAVDDGPEAEALRHFQEKEMKKAWWSAFGGRKSMDVATYHYGREAPRKSLDIRPSLDSLSHFAKKSMEGLSRKSVDYERPMIPPDPYNTERRPSLLSRLVGAWSRK